MEIKTINVPENGIVKIFTANGLDEKEQKKGEDIIGAINTPNEYLTKRHDNKEIEKNQTHVKFSYEDSKIILCTTLHCVFASSSGSAFTADSQFSGGQWLST